jgi:hypothetical protein
MLHFQAEIGIKDYLALLCNNNLINYDQTFIEQPFGFSIACGMGDILLS